MLRIVGWHLDDLHVCGVCHENGATVLVEDDDWMDIFDAHPGCVPTARDLVGEVFKKLAE